jgi:CheY-like chemotaxis protein
MPLIMVADDDANVVAIYKDYLESRGHQVVTVPDGMQAAEKAQDWRPHLIVLDVQMPGAYGTTVYEMLQRNAATAGLPVIFISGVPGPRVEQLIPNVRNVRFMRKPLDLAQLDAAIQELLAPPPKPPTGP